jgi:hypothetical protein
MAFESQEGISLNELLAGRHVVEAGAGKGLLIWPLNSIRWGDDRLDNRCPDARKFLDRLEYLLKRGKN